jgi:hypothetical protein
MFLLLMSICCAIVRNFQKSYGAFTEAGVVRSAFVLGSGPSFVVKVYLKMSLIIPYIQYFILFADMIDVLS